MYKVTLILSLNILIQRYLQILQALRTNNLFATEMKHFKHGEFYSLFTILLKLLQAFNIIFENYRD